MAKQDLEELNQIAQFSSKLALVVGLAFTSLAFNVTVANATTCPSSANDATTGVDWSGCDLHGWNVV